MNPKSDQQSRDQSAEEQVGGCEAEKDQRQRDPRQQRVSHGIGHQRQPAKYDEGAQHAVGKSNQGTTKKGALHELMPERFAQPVHVGLASPERCSCVPEKTCVR